MDAALREAAAWLALRLAAHERVILAGSREILRAFYTPDGGGAWLWLVREDAQEGKRPGQAEGQLVREGLPGNALLISNALGQGLRRLYHVYEFSDRFFLLWEGDAFLEGIRSLACEGLLGDEDIRKLFI